MKKTLTLLTLGILFLSLKAYPAIANVTPVEINEYSQLSGTNIHISPQYENLIDSDKKNIITVLTIDGGGMHGIIPLKVLEQIETETNMPTSSLFNFMGGTSTGAIITSLLSLPDSDGKPKYTASEVLSNYKNDSKQIFKRDFMHSIYTLFGFYGPLLPRVNINQVMSAHFGDVTLKDLLSNVIIPCGLLIDYSPYWFKAHEAKQDSNKNFYVKDIVLAATATPGLFEPYHFFNTNKNWSDYGVDAGIFVNNPTAQIYSDLQLLYPKRKFFIVSLGTLQRAEDEALKNPRIYSHLGIINGIFPIINTGTAFSSQLTDMQIANMTQSSNSSIVGYIRINMILSKNTTNIFSGDEKNVKKIDNLGNIHVGNNKENIKLISDILLDIKSSTIQDQ